MFGVALTQQKLKFGPFSTWKRRSY